MMPRSIAELEQVRPGQRGQRVDDDQQPIGAGTSRRYGPEHPAGPAHDLARPGARRACRPRRRRTSTTSARPPRGRRRRPSPSLAGAAWRACSSCARRPSAEHLAVRARCVVAAAAVVGAVGDDPAVVDEHHPIGQRDGGRPVGDDERGALRHHLGQRVADLVLLGRVDRGGGVVEDQDAGVGQDGPGDGDALALPARERVAALADLGGVAVRAASPMNWSAPARRAARSMLLDRTRRGRRRRCWRRGCR